MNFLSHYYFDKANPDSNMVIGTVLPDLVKNANKDWNLYPQKQEELFIGDEQLLSLLKGWKRHLEVDLIFHSSDFFVQQMASLKQLLIPILRDSPVRPSFLAHIGVELVLDHLLVVNKRVSIDSFYNHLANVDQQTLILFLKKCGASDHEIFFKFFNGFKSSRYLFSYEKLANISYTLQRICMRLWQNPFNDQTVLRLTEQLEIYKPMLERDYLDIFVEIEKKLN